MKRSISHTTFCIAFCTALYVTCNLVGIGDLTKWFQGRTGLDVWSFTAYLAAGLCLFLAFFSLLAHPRTIKAAAIVITALSAAATYFIAKYNVAIDSSMVVNAFHTDATEVGQLISPAMIPYIGLLIGLPVALIVWVRVTFKPGFRYLGRSLILLGTSLCLATVLMYSNYNAIQRAGNISAKYIVYSLVPINVLSSSIGIALNAAKSTLALRRTPAPIPATVATPGNLVVVLAVGESSRRKNFSLYGYDRRQTNPELENLSGLHVLNAVAARGSTINALPEILEKNGQKLPAIISAAGIPTSCYVNYTLYDNCGAVGETAVSGCGHAGHCYDEDVIPLLESNLASYRSGYRFIVLHLGGGSHGPIYRDRHPPEFLRFQPTCNDADVASQCTAEQLYNSYDNTILYVDHVVSSIVRSLDRSGAPYVFLYLSDHGESLMENGVLFHGMPPGVSLPKEQAEIPLIEKSSIPVSIAKRAEYRQTDVAATVLGLFSIRSPSLDEAGSFLSR